MFSQSMFSIFGRALLNKEGIASDLALASRVDVPGQPFECLSQAENWLNPRGIKDL
jgi:hypothetical protein